MPEFTEAQIEELKKAAKADGVKELLGVLKLDESKLRKFSELSTKGIDPDKVLAENSSLKLSFDVYKATVKHGASDPEYAEFMYGKHLASLDEEGRKKANPDEFLSSMKAKDEYKHLFSLQRRTSSMGNSDRPKDSDRKAGDPIDMSTASSDEISKYLADLGLRAP